MSEPTRNERDKDLLLNHEYDGIREYDNPMPTWWKWIFWGSFYFSVFYVAHYHLTGNGPSVQAQYEADLALAREREALAAMGSEVTEESLAKLMENPAMVADAAPVFVSRCGPCHGNQGEGLIGPNLTDSHWLHGDASLTSIYDVIARGVPSKGMPAWERQLRPIELGKLTAYVGSLRNTNIPGPRGAEGKTINPASPNH